MEIDMMKEPDVMVYLMTGFLDSGKTQFLNFTLSQDYFQIDGKTLLPNVWYGVDLEKRMVLSLIHI